MASGSISCRECERSSSRCHDCRRSFCEYHISEHHHDLTEQFQDLTGEYSNLRQILALPPSYESLTESTELIRKIDQWEVETIRQVKEIAEQTREKVRHRSNTITIERFGPELQQLHERFEQSQRSNNVTEMELQQLTTQLNDLKIQVENSLLTTADIRTTSIDWSKHLQMLIKQQKVRGNPREIHFDRLTSRKATINLDVRGADWHVLGSPSPTNSTFLHYQHTVKSKLLSLVDVHGQQKPIPWSEDQSIWDSCWSTFLNRFFILADRRLYTYDEENSGSNACELIQVVRPKQDQMEFLRCTCSDETLFITYDERSTSIDEYNLAQWTMIHRYDNVVKSNEIIISLAISETNANLIGMTVLDDRRHWHFQLRDRSMLLISSIALDRSEFNRRLISLPNQTNHWLVVHTGSKLFTLINETGQSKRTIECAENVDLVTFIPVKNCLVLLTQKSKLKFFFL